MTTSLTNQSASPIGADDRLVPTEHAENAPISRSAETACGRMYQVFLLETTVRWPSRFPLLILDKE